MLGKPGGWWLRFVLAVGLAGACLGWWIGADMQEMARDKAAIVAEGAQWFGR